MQFFNAIAMVTKALLGLAIIGEPNLVSMRPNVTEKRTDINIIV